MLNMQVQGKRRRWLDNIRDDMKDYEMTEDMKNRSAWHMKITAGPLLHGGGLPQYRASS